MENSVKLCGLWKQPSKDEKRQFLSGKINPLVKLIIFANREKKNPNAVGLRLHDHIIIGNGTLKWVSLAQKGVLP